MKSSRCISFLNVLCLLLGLNSFGWAQTPTGTKTPFAFDSEKANTRLVRVSELLEDSDDGAYGTALRELRSVLRRQLTQVSELKKVESDVEEVKKGAEAFRSKGLEEQPPYSVRLLDSLGQDLDTVEQNKKALELALSTSQKSLKQAREALKDVEKTGRRLLDDKVGADDPSEIASLEQKINLNQLRKELAEEKVTLQRLETLTLERELERGTARQELLVSKLAVVEEKFSFGRQSLDTQLAENSRVLAELENSLESVQEKLAASEAKLDQLEDGSDEGLIEAQNAWVATHAEHVRLIEDQIQWALERRALWESRFQVWSGDPDLKPSEAREAATVYRNQLRDRQGVLEAELSQIRTLLADLLDEDEKDIGEGIRQNVQAFIFRQKIIEKAIDAARESELLAERLLRELGNRSKGLDPGQQWDQFGKQASNFWNLELYTLGDSSVTVKKLTIAIFILIFGLIFVRRVTNLIFKRLLSKLPLQEGSRVNVERIIRYFLTFLVFLFALHVVNIPLTIFAFLGGSLAIAFGFGAQNILNNFISGLILMVEKPVKVGDLIDVDGTIGFVEEIGGRSTRVRLPVGIHVILPNSTLLENRVTNWTLHDKYMRTHVAVGVAYGSPTETVEEILMEVVTRHPMVRNIPAPMVLFRNFGDSSLDFEVHFWIEAKSPADPLLVSHKIRMAIDAAFREHNIEIPFPQRDVHLKSVPAIEFRAESPVLGNGNPKASKKAKSPKKKK